MRFASFNVEVSGKRIVRESGYHEFPVCVPRWMKIPGGSYGIGPVYDALPDCKELNETKRMEKAAQDLAISGMWIAEDDGVLNPRTVKVGPRRIIVANSTESMKPLLTGADFNVAFTAEERLQASIRKIMMADQLQPQDGPAMTATEVHVRVALIRQLLGPVYGRFGLNTCNRWWSAALVLRSALAFFLPPPRVSRVPISTCVISPRWPVRRSWKM